MSQLSSFSISNILGLKQDPVNSKRSRPFEEEKKEVNREDMDVNHSCASPCSPPSEASHPSSPSQRKRRRKSYSKFSDCQLESLEKAFKEGPHPTKQQTKELGEEIGLQQNQVQVWFQNRRCRQRKYLAARRRHAAMHFEEAFGEKKNVLQCPPVFSIYMVPSFQVMTRIPRVEKNDIKRHPLNVKN